MAHQRTAQITNDNVLSALQNCAIRFANSDAEAKKLSYSLRSSEQFLESLDRGQFASYIRDHTKTAIAVGVVKPDFSAEDQLSHSEWQELRDRMMRDHGRVADTQPLEPKSAAEHGSVPPHENISPRKEKRGQKTKRNAKPQSEMLASPPPPSPGAVTTAANDPGEPSDTW